MGGRLQGLAPGGVRRVPELGGMFPCEGCWLVNAQAALFLRWRGRAKSDHRNEVLGHWLDVWGCRKHGTSFPRIDAGGGNSGVVAIGERA